MDQNTKKSDESLEMKNQSSLQDITYKGSEKAN